MKPFLLFLLAIALTHGVAAQTRLSGTVLGAEGNPPALAHVHLASPSGDYSRPLSTWQVEPDGSFQGSVTPDGLLTVWITATDHTPIGFPIVVRSGQDLSFTAVLAPYPLNEPIASLKITGDWSGFRLSRSESMQRRSDGVFVYDLTVTADTVGYQVIGAERNGRSINGTMSDYYVYDGGGDYISVVQVTGEKVRIEYDPSRAIRTKRSGLPSIIFEGSQSASLERMARLEIRWRQAREASRAALRKHKEEGKDESTFSFEFSDLLEEMTHALDDRNSSPELKQLAALRLLTLFSMTQGKVVPEHLAGRALRFLPSSSPLWGLDPSFVYSAIAMRARQERKLPLLSTSDPASAEQALRSKFMREFLETNPDRTVRALALSELVWDAAIAEAPEFLSLYAELKQHYGDLEAVSYTLKQLDPANPIAKGQPVPPFEVALMGSDERITHTSLRGTYYLIDFWAVWCGPCVKEMPNLHKVYDRFRRSNFTILSLSFDNKPADVIEFRKKKWKMPWLHAFVVEGFNSRIARDFRVDGIPKPVLVGPDGVILNVLNLRGEELEKTLAAALSKRKGN